MIGLWKFMTCVALLVAAASVFMSAVLFSKIQDERVNASVQACLRESDRSEATLTYLASLGADKGDLDQAGRFFPVLNEGQCEKRAQKTVGTPRPK